MSHFSNVNNGDDNFQSSIFLRRKLFAGSIVVVSYSLFYTDLDEVNGFQTCLISSTQIKMLEFLTFLTRSKMILPFLGKLHLLLLTKI